MATPAKKKTSTAPIKEKNRTNYTDLLKIVREKTGFVHDDVKAITDACFDAIREELSAGREVVITGFGTWYVNQMKGRETTNPITKEGTITIPDTIVARWSAGMEMKRAINGKPPVIRKPSPGRKKAAAQEEAAE